MSQRLGYCDTIPWIETTNKNNTKHERNKDQNYIIKVNLTVHAASKTKHKQQHYAKVCPYKVTLTLGKGFCNRNSTLLGCDKIYYNAGQGENIGCRVS